MVKHQTNVHKLGVTLGIDPVELLPMINGKAVPTKVIIQGLAKQLDSDPRYLEKLADEIRKDLGVKIDRVARVRLTGSAAYWPATLIRMKLTGNDWGVNRRIATTP
jgi:hypothetical protein